MYVQKVQINFISDPKSFWRYIKELKTDNGIPGTLELDDKSLTEWYEPWGVYNLFSPDYSTNYLNINDRLYNTLYMITNFSD